jgi:hypothetical protein
MAENSISRMIDGVTLSGTWSVKDGVVTLTTAWGRKSAQVGNLSPEGLAHIMLRELYEDIAAGFPSDRPERLQ